jgi:putative peptidoglycan lipid II flippase
VAARNAAIIFAAVTLGRTALGVRSLAVGVVLGGLCLVLIQGPGLRDALPRPNLNFRHPAIRRIYGLYLPITIGLISNAIALVVDRNLAWGAGTHALGAMRYATALNQMILGLVATATSIASLPTLSRHFANRDEDGYQRTLSNGLKMITIMVVPATLGMAAISWPAVRLLFEHGATDQGGAHAILIALLCYLPGTFFAAFDQALIFAFYARHNTRTPVIVGVLAVCVYFTVALSLVQTLGMAGLVMANSAQFTFHAIVMWVLLRRNLGQVGDATVSRTLRRALVAGAVMAVAVLAVSELIRMLHGGIVFELLDVAVPIALGAVIYATLLRLLGVEEIQAIQRGVLAKLGRA